MLRVAMGLVLILLAGSLVYAVREARRRKRVRKRRASGARWTVGEERSDSPLAWHPERAAVIDRRLMPRPTYTIADPFLFEHNGRRALFAEVLYDGDDRAGIGLFLPDSAAGGWRFDTMVIEEPFHLSYPYVFRDGQSIFMVPESKGAHSIRLYEATSFPETWRFKATLLADRKLVDPSIVRWQGQWYLFASRKRVLHLFTADQVEGPWQRHPASPVRRGNHARCAGRIIEHEGRLVRFAQEQAGGYGGGVHAYLIDELTPTHYRETPHPTNPILAPGGSGWTATGMHHIDVHPHPDGGYVAVYDGEGYPESER